ncbi:manganese-binding transcriptional regulator MntR [Chlamydiales bacterium]|nr:manganese-binding transcriptional regulator MntR [Chlamydiales bacterium]
MTIDFDAAPFIAARKCHQLEIAEDYTELINDLIEEKGEARVGDIATFIGVSHVTALRAVQRLERDGYVITNPHKPIQLTEKGRKLGQFSKKRHQTLFAFLIKIGVPSEVAKIDAEGIEHHISDKTLEVIEKYL